MTNISQLVARISRAQQIEGLKQARARIDTPEKWTRGAYARDRAGFKVETNSLSACKFCAVGALPFLACEDLLRLALPASYSNMENFNDHPSTTHAMVLDVYDKAIKLGEEIVSQNS